MVKRESTVPIKGQALKEALEGRGVGLKNASRQIKHCDSYLHVCIIRGRLPMKEIERLNELYDIEYAIYADDSAPTKMRRSDRILSEVKAMRAQIEALTKEVSEMKKLIKEAST